MIFVRKRGRLTSGQQQALETLLPQYELPFSENCIDFQKIFGYTAPVLVEIGFGNGQVLLEMARQNPTFQYIGIDVYRPGIGRLLVGIKKHEVHNIRIICHDAIPVLESMFPNSSIDQIWILFPDPWPKRRHHKRRLIQTPFVNLLHTKLKKGGKLYLATDWAPYAEHIQKTLEHASGFSKTECSFSRPLTHFEQRGQRHGHSVFNLAFLTTI